MSNELATREKLVQQFPQNTLFRIQLAGAIHNYGLLLQRQDDRLEEALGWFERARTEQETALSASPDNRQGRLYLGQHLKQLGNCYVKLRRGRDVLEVARALAALELSERDAPYRAALLDRRVQFLRLLLRECHTRGARKDHARQPKRRRGSKREVSRNSSKSCRSRSVSSAGTAICSTAYRSPAPPPG